MKIRNGFVTNSSSSSFILSKDSCPIENLDTESIFKLIKEMYTEYETKFKDIYAEVVKETQGEDIYTYFNKLWTKETNKKFRGKYGVDLLDIYDYDRAMSSFKIWKDCETYEDFVKLFESNKKLHYGHLPFEIINYHEVEGIKDNYTLRETIGWYSYEMQDEPDMDEYDEIMPEDTEDAHKEALLKLGDAGIHSECGWIADYVVEKLRELSVHSCNHMG